MSSNLQKMPIERVEDRQTRASWIASALRAEIIACELRPNAKLNLEQLRDRFQISLSPLREAISRLVAEGLVQLEDQRGFRVAPVSVANLSEITLLRAELDTLALKQSIAHANLDWEAAVTGAVYRLDRACRDSGNVDLQQSWMDALSDYYTHLLGRQNLPQLCQFTKILRHQMDRYISLLEVFDPRTCQSKAAEYRTIAEAAIACDEPLASALLSSQIRRNCQALKVTLDTYLANTEAEADAHSKPRHTTRP